MNQIAGTDRLSNDHVKLIAPAKAGETMPKLPRGRVTGGLAPLADENSAVDWSKSAALRLKTYGGKLALKIAQEVLSDNKGKY